MAFSSTFVCTGIYYIRCNFTCSSTNVIYLVERINFKCQYVAFATPFKQQRKIVV